MSQSPLVGASGPAQVYGGFGNAALCVSIPSGRGFWAGLMASMFVLNVMVNVSIPSGRGFWAGTNLWYNALFESDKSQSPLVGASGPAQVKRLAIILLVFVSIPSGRGFWAGDL